MRFNQVFWGFSGQMASLSILFMRFWLLIKYGTTRKSLSILFMRFPQIQPSCLDSFALSILFMRFLALILAGSTSNCDLSILFMRFPPKGPGPNGSSRIFQFSLWDSFKAVMGILVIPVDFQFSLWDSWRIQKLDHTSKKSLSILFMRFKPLNLSPLN